MNIELLLGIVLILAIIALSLFIIDRLIIPLTIIAGLILIGLLCYMAFPYVVKLLDLISRGFYFVASFPLKVMGIEAQYHFNYVWVLVIATVFFIAFQFCRSNEVNSWG